MRIGTLEGELCSTEAIGVSLVGMGLRGLNRWGTKVIALGNSDVLKCMNMRCAVGDCGRGCVLEMVKSPNIITARLCSDGGDSVTLEHWNSGERYVA